MEQLVRVKETYDDGTALVFRIRESACSGDCHKCSGCGAAKETVTFTAKNPIGCLLYTSKRSYPFYVNFCIAHTPLS